MSWRAAGSGNRRWGRCCAPAVGVVPALRHYPSADNFRAARFCAVGDVIWFVAFAVASDRLASTEGSTSPCRRRCGLRWRALDGLVYRRRVSGDACWRYALGHARVEAIPASEFYRLCAVAVDVDNQRCHATASFSFWFLALLRRCRCLTVLFFCRVGRQRQNCRGPSWPKW